MKAILALTWILFACENPQESATQAVSSYANPPAGSVDTSFLKVNPNGFVMTMIEQSDGKLLIGGQFDRIGDVSISRLARLHPDGSLDESFDLGGGVNKPVSKMALQKDGKILVTGGFTLFDGITVGRIVRLNTNGSRDTSFVGGIGLSDSILTMVPQENGKIMLGGYFSTYKGAAVYNIARLNEDGTLDKSFNPGLGANNHVYSILPLADGKYLIAGTFSRYNGIPCYGIARINSNGSLDTTFKHGTSLIGAIHLISPLPDGKLILAGSFSQLNGTNIKGIARIHSDGALDNAFKAPQGPIGSVESIVHQPDGRMVLGGNVVSTLGILNQHIARIHSDGAMDLSFDPKEGTDYTVSGMIPQKNGKLVVSGYFNRYGLERHNFMVRIHY